MSELPKEYALLKSDFSISDTVADGFAGSFTLGSVGLWASDVAVDTDLQGVKGSFPYLPYLTSGQGTYLDALLAALELAASTDTAANVCCANRAPNC